MTTISPTQDHTRTDTTTDPSTTSTTTKMTKHYSVSTNTSPERRTRATRSRDSHRGITICRRVAPGRVARPNGDLRSPNSIPADAVGRWPSC